MTDKITRGLGAALGALMLGGLAATPASATMVQVTVSNNQGAGGLSLTPLYFGFHNGSVDLFNAGAAASNGIETIAETGDFGPLRDERLAQQADSAGGVALGTSIGAPGPIEPGESASFTVDLDSVANRYMLFTSMVIPSNDTFVGVDDPTRFSLFDAAGNFLGPQTINIDGSFAYDAGTEVNDASATGGAAFVIGADAAQGAAENGVITPASSLAAFIGASLANGTTLGSNIDFSSPSFSFASVEIAAVPVPPAFLLMFTGLAGLGFAARRKKQQS